MSPTATGRIVHVGAGAFQRAHQAWYLQRLHERGARGWWYAEGAIREDAAPLLEALAQQGGAYTLELVTPQGERSYETIRSIRNVIPWESDARALVAAAADAETRIVSYTVTEGGYYVDATGALDERQADVAADLDGARRTVYGATAAILRARVERGGGPLTLLSCDNVRGNGTRLRTALLAFLELRGERELVRWTTENATFPNSMVDRITPASNDAVRARVLAATGVADRCPVIAEHFSQWVIEDEFAAGRPAWDEVGAQLVRDVRPYENAKIRILNASHSAIAWAGTLAGYSFIHEGFADRRIRELVERYVDAAVIPSLGPSPLDLAAYRDVIFERFTNPFVADTNERVASDSVAKIRGFIEPTMRDALALGLPPEPWSVLPALYYRFLERRERRPVVYRDPQMPLARSQAFFAASEPLSAFCGDRALWGDLAGEPSFEAAVSRGLALTNALTG